MCPSSRPFRRPKLPRARNRNEHGSHDRARRCAPGRFLSQENEMEQDDRDFSPDAWEERIEVAYRRMQQALPALPWLPRVMNLKRLRRQVRRARAGVIEPE